MASLARDGFEIVSPFLCAAEIADLRAALESLEIAPGHRGLMQRVIAVANLARSTRVLKLLEEATGNGCFPVRSIFFDKTPETNWLVSWHQDLSIAVDARQDLPGFGPWSMKEGVPHVQPPMEILESMITLRLHLDACDERNGALRVIPGSHLHGRLKADQIAHLRTQGIETTCSMKEGDGLLMRPLLLHASSAATKPTHRRVIHLEYATQLLPGGLKWAECPEVETTAPLRQRL